MHKQVLNPATVASPIGDYSQAVAAGDLLFIAGQVALDASGHFVGVGDVQAQTRQVMRNIGDILHDAGATFDDIVKMTTLLTDMDDRSAVAQVRREFVARDFPAATLCEITRLALPEARIEVEAIALLRHGRPAQ